MGRVTQLVRQASFKVFQLRHLTTMGKTIHNLTLKRENSNRNWGFRIIGGKDEGQTFKVEKVLTGYPSYYAGMKVHDFLVSVNGQEIFAMNHAQVVNLIKNAGDSISLAVERGDFIVPNFEEIWPSGKNKNKPSERPDPMDYVLEAMKLGIPGERNKDFTTVGKPRVTVNQYDNPINCYSEDTLEDMTNSSTWMKTEEQVATIENDPTKFNPANSQVLAVIADAEKGITFQAR